MYIWLGINRKSGKADGGDPIYMEGDDYIGAVVIANCPSEAVAMVKDAQAKAQLFQLEGGHVENWKWCSLGSADDAEPRIAFIAYGLY